MTKHKITAVLGPTNTGKTHLAIETMLSFDSGMIGFPLRLLAREVYDKIIKKINVITIFIFPLPAVNKVPEPQPPPSCIAKPKIKDPTRTEIPTGAIAPIIVPS